MLGKNIFSEYNEARPTNADYVFASNEGGVTQR